MRCDEVGTEVGGRMHEILDVGGEVGVGELSFGRSKPGKIEAQHADPGNRETCSNAFGGQNVLGAREAVCEQGEASHRAGGKVETCRELSPGTPLERGADHGAVDLRKHDGRALAVQSPCGSLALAPLTAVRKGVNGCRRVQQWWSSYQGLLPISQGSVPAATLLGHHVEEVWPAGLRETQPPSPFYVSCPPGRSRPRALLSLFVTGA